MDVVWGFISGVLILGAILLFVSGLVTGMWHFSNQACEEYGRAYGVTTYYSDATNCVVMREGKAPIRIWTYIESVDK